MASARPSEPLFDLASYARRGPGRRDRLSPDEIAQITRTVRRAPEVMVKVLSRGGKDLKAVGRHIDYLRDREDGELEVEMDDGRQLSGEGVTKELLEDWDLELEAHRNRADLGVRGGGSQKLVHKLLFSMPAGTPSQKVLLAVKHLAREEFGLKHRYAMVLHTDEPHPHVHLVLKAVSEQGVRLHIKKAALRHWRAGFAQNLRQLGVEANATERAVRGECREAKKDGIYRANLRGDSTYARERADAVAGELLKGHVRAESGKSTLIDTRQKVEAGWQTIADRLHTVGQRDLARDVQQFVQRMPPPRTEKELIAARLLEHARARRQEIFR
jgi:Relaxase/Mobilisation nuclease domain